ncbi:MAG: DNA-binding transcriptional regulator GbsR (MarR family) [Candidatus Pelagisphaera sp.]|jgi:DNA-binding transcriptional regulator GbsR (MarR family)
MSEIETIKQDFVSQWGALGSQWGVNRTMAMIHSLLLVSTKPLTTDQVMEELEISRGNANTNLRELASWGLVRSVVLKGERKDFYEAEKDVWRIFCIVARERKRRETEPASKVLQDCVSRAQRLKTKEAKALSKQLNELNEFVELANTIMDKVASKERSVLVPKLLKLLA